MFVLSNVVASRPSENDAVIDGKVGFYWVAIGRALQPFPRSKRSRHVSAHSAFQLGLSTLEERIRHKQRRGAPASEGHHLPLCIRRLPF